MGGHASGQGASVSTPEGGCGCLERAAETFAGRDTPTEVARHTLTRAAETVTIVVTESVREAFALVCERRGT